VDCCLEVCEEFALKKGMPEFFAGRSWLHPQGLSRPCPDQPLLHTRSRTFPWEKFVRRILRRTWEAGILPLLRACRERLRKQLGNALHLDGRSIGEHFGDALHHFRGVIAHSDDGVGAVFAGVL
jgi:hypothetical protein